MRVRPAVRAPPAFEALIRRAPPPVRAPGRAGALRGRRQRAPHVGVPGKLGRGWPQPGRMPAADGIPGASTVAPARGRCAPGTAHGRAPLASGCRGTLTRSVRGHRFRAAACCCAKTAPRRPRIIRAAGVCQPRRCRARRRQEHRDHRRPTASAYAPGRRTTGTGVLGRRLLRKVCACYLFAPMKLVSLPAQHSYRAA
jgi:hypothetical protein